MTEHQKRINETLFPRCRQLEPMEFYGFIYSMSSYPIELGELLYFCIDDIQVPLQSRKYFVGICKEIREDGTHLVYSAGNELLISEERVKRLVMTIPVGTIANHLAN